MKLFVSVILVFCMVLAIAGAASAAQGTWKSYATDSTGSLTSAGSQSAYVTSTRTGAETKVNGLSWTLAGSQAADMTSTVGGSWQIADTSGSAYNRMWITPGSFDASRGIIMAKIRVNSASGSTNTTFGFSTNTNGVQLALRGGTNGAVRLRGGDGTPIAGYTDPANFDQSVYRVYAISWVGGTFSAWYSNGADWASSSAGWTNLATNWNIMAETAKQTDGSNVVGLVLNDGSTGNLYNANIDWIAHSTYDNINGEMNPWDFNPAPQAPAPEPGSILALGSGLLGMAGFAIRRRRA